jgi:hypothetical protein
VTRRAADSTAIAWVPAGGTGSLEYFTMTNSVTCHKRNPVMPVPLRPARQPAATLRGYLNDRGGGTDGSNPLSSSAESCANPTYKDCYRREQQG